MKTHTVMFSIKETLLFLYIIIIMSACERHYSSDKIPEVPEIDEQFYNTALAYLNNSIENYPTNADNYYKKAQVLMAFGNNSAAMLQAEKATILKEDDPDYLYLLAKLYAINSKADLAIETAFKAISNGAPKPMLNELLAAMYLESGSLEIALSYINQAIADNPKKESYYYTKGKIYLALEDTVNAEKNILHAIEATTLNKEAYVTLANIYRRKGNYVEAGNYIEKILQITPEDNELQYAKSLILNKMNLPDSAKSILKGIIERDSTYVRAYTQLGQYFFEKRNLDSAHWYATKAIILEPKYVEPMLIQARILDRKRQYYEAIQKYEAVLSIDAANTAAIGELRYLRGKVAYLQRQREEQRAREAEELPKLTPIF